MMPRLFLWCLIGTLALGLLPPMSLPHPVRNVRFLWLCALIVWSVSLLTR